MNRLFHLVQSFLQTLSLLINRSFSSSSRSQEHEWEGRCSSVVPTKTSSGDARLRQMLALALGLLFGILVSAFCSGN